MMPQNHHCGVEFTAKFAAVRGKAGRLSRTGPLFTPLVKDSRRVHEVFGEAKRKDSNGRYTDLPSDDREYLLVHCADLRLAR
jgi:hypothetical protein